MRKMMIPLFVIVAAMFCLGDDCDGTKPSSDVAQQQQQEVILGELSAKTGMPSIKNGRERGIMKDIFELRDQEGLVTYTYVFSEMTGKLTFLGDTIGYGIPCATQFTNPQKIAASGAHYGYAVLPQADPNGLFSPASAEGTWVLMREPKTGNVRPQYIEPRIMVFTFKLEDDDPRLAYGGPARKAEKG